MALRVYEIVERRLLDGAKLAAGFTGANNPISWVNVMEILDVPESLQKGEMVITTGYHFEDEERYLGLIGKLRERDISCLVVQLGYYVDAVPEYMIQAANREGLPILTLPPHMTFSAITHILIDEIQRQPKEEGSQNLGRLLTLLSEKMSRAANELHDIQKGYLLLLIPVSDDFLMGPELEDGLRQVRSYLIAQSGRCIQAELPDGCTAFYMEPGEGNTIHDIIFELNILLTFLSERQHIDFFVGADDVDEPEMIAQHYKTAVECCRTLKRAGAKRGVCRSQNIPFFSLFNTINRNNREAVRGKQTELQSLLDYDRTHRSNYVHTLRVYLAHEGSQARTAARLFIHRHTLVKRIEKICILGGWDLDDYYTRTYLSVCLMLHDYFAI